LSKNYFILWVGRAVKRKIPEIFLKLAQKLPNEKFIVILNKSVDGKYWVRNFNQAKKIDNVQFIEFIIFLKLILTLKTAKIFINTSLYEGFLNTFIQSLKN